jgi:hypothetical protein
MARPVEKPLKLAGKWTYTRFGGELICFPSDVCKGDEEELIAAINIAYDKNSKMYLSGEQHERLERLRRNYAR